MTASGVKDGNNDFRRSVVGPPGATRGGRYYLRPDYAHAALGPPPHHHHHETQRHDFPPRDFLPQEKMDDIYARHKDDFFSGRPKDDLPPPGGYGGPPTPDDPYARVPPSSRPPRIGDRFPRMQDYPPPAPTPEGRGTLYGPSSAPPGTTTVGVGSNTVGGQNNNAGGGERVSRLLELYGTLDTRGGAGSRSNHDLYGSLDGRASRLSDIFPTSENRLRQADFRSDETRSLSGREGALADLYRRRELPPAPPEYRLHDYRPSRHDFRAPPKNQQPPVDQDVIENPMYDVERRSGQPRTPGPRVATPTTTPSGSHHSHLAHMGHHSSSPTPGHHNHSSLQPGITTPGHAVGLTPTHPHSVGMGVGHPQTHQPGHPTGHGMPPTHSVVHPTTAAERGEVRYTAAIAQQEEAHRLQNSWNRRIVPANRVENQRAISAVGSSLGPTLVSTSSRQQHQHNTNQLSQHQQHSHMPSHSSSNTTCTTSNSSTLTPSQPQITHPPTQITPNTRAVSLPLASSTSVPQGTTSSSFSKPLHHHNLSRPMSRKEQLKKFMKKEAKEFFGLDDDESESKQKLKWEDKRRRLASRKYGPLRDGAQPTSYDPFSSNEQAAQQENFQFHSRAPKSFSGDFHALRDVPESRASSYLADSVDANAWPRPPPNRAKDSVAKMTWDGLAYVASTVSKRRAKSQASGTPGGRSKSRSYAPSASNEDIYDEPDASPATTATTATTTTPAALANNSAPSRVTPNDHIPMDALENEVFFDRKISGSPDGDSNIAAFEATKEVGSSTSRYHPSVQGQWRLVDVVQQVTGVNDSNDGGSGRGSARIGRCRVWRRILDHCFDNSDRRQYGMGFVGRYLGRSYKKEIIKETDLRKQLDEIEDYRPYFTWWVTTVQVFILFLSILCYGIAPHGVSLRQQHGQVLMASLSIQTVDYWEPENLWIGPRAADLIHLGAKFAPCMRKDEKIFRHIEEQRRAERETGCCIRNDDSGCVQSSRRECSPIGQSDMDSVSYIPLTSRLSVWKKWSELAKGPDGRISGSVCGQDPNYCKEPASIPPHEWPDDITQWPICKKRVSVSAVRKINAAEHMACEVVGHPCCIGIHGECRITTREYCNFVRGYFHEEATLCSQVSCLNNVCGMIHFYSPDRPDQFYRLWTSLFIHAGIFHLLITVLLQYYLMRDLEKLAGPVRIGVIYIVSGIAGNLASAIFVPYRAEVGPSGSQFGLLACLFVEVINCWPLIRYPWRALLRLVAITLVLFLIGLLPWVDNYAHIFGFIFGFLLSYALLPYVSFGPYDRRRKVLLIWVCLVAVLVMLTALIILFYVTPIYECKICEYLNCIPLTRDFCAEQNINLDKKLDII